MTAAFDSVNATDYSLFDYLTILRRRWLWSLIPVVLLVAAAYLYSTTRADRFVASANVLLADTAAQRTLDAGSGNTGSLSNEISLARSDAVEQLVVEDLGDLPDIAISSQSKADVLTFTAESDDPDRAALAANTWAESYVEVKRDEVVASIATAIERLQSRLEEIRTERQNLRQPLDDLEARITDAAPEDAPALQAQYDRLADDLSYELDLLAAQSQATLASLANLELQAELSTLGTARIVQVANPPQERRNPPLSRDLALGATVGLLAGFGLALLADTRDNTIKSSGDVETATGLPVLAAIPDAGSKYKGELARATWDEPEGVYADGYQKLRAAIEFATMNKKLKSVLITSPNPKEGKSTTASNLAIALSTVGKRTILLDLDFRRGRIHQIYGIPNAPGLSDHILHDAQLATVARHVEGAEHLFIIPNGTTPPNPAAFVGTPRFLSTVEWMEGQAETVVLDAPPLFAVSDTYTLAKNVDAVVLTARVGKTTKSELQEVLSVLGQVDANVVGVVLVAAKKGSGSYSYYNYGPARKRRWRRRTPRPAMPLAARTVQRPFQPQYVPPFDAGEVWVRYHDTGQIDQIPDLRNRPTPVPPPERDTGATRR